MQAEQETVQQAFSKTAKSRAQVEWSEDDRRYNQLWVSSGADFRSSARNGDGSISWAELWSAAKLIPHSKSRAEVRELFRIVDADQDGTLELRDYLDVVTLVDES